MFIDEAKINVKGGNGGDGCVSFFYLKGKRKRMASGGDGGRGGNVILEATRSVSTLSNFRKKIHFKAQDGKRGMPNKKTGKDGENLIIHVPVGTIVKDENGTIMADLDKEGKRIVVATGGIGGRGNSSFVSQTRRFPSFAEKGEVVSDKWINLELRILADVALVGFPNVGKSTIISKISSARPKIAEYPFTTLTPNLGVVLMEDKSFTVADVPGIIKDAHKGCGLGDKFLRHIKRAYILVVVLDGEKVLCNVENMIETFDILREEIRLYDEELYRKDYVVAVNKIDLINSQPGLKLLELVQKKLKEKSGKEVYLISALTGQGLRNLVLDLASRVELHREKLGEVEAIGKETKTKIYSINKEKLDEEKIEVYKQNNVYVIKSKKLERMVSMTDLENEEALRYLKDRLAWMGIGDKLKEMGVEEGSTVLIGNLVFELEEV